MQTKHRKDKPEIKRTAYLEGIAGDGVQRTKDRGWSRAAWGTMPLSAPACVDLTLRTLVTFHVPPPKQISN